MSTVGNDGTYRQTQALHKFLTELRARYPSAWFVFVIEGNYGGGEKCNTLAAQCKLHPPCQIVSKLQVGTNWLRPGVNVDEQEKDRFVKEMYWYLRSEAFALGEKMIGEETCPPDLPPEVKAEWQPSVDDFRLKILDQMINYRAVVVPSKDKEIREIKWKYTGKIGGKKDDGISVVQMLLRHMTRWVPCPATVRVGPIGIGPGLGRTLVSRLGGVPLTYASQVRQCACDHENDLPATVQSPGAVHDRATRDGRAPVRGVYGVGQAVLVVPARRTPR